MQLTRRKDEQQRIVDCLLTLFETLPSNRKPSELMLVGYQMALSDVPVEVIEQACLRALSSCRFAPTPCELRELGGAIDTDGRAAVAWHEFASACNSTLAYYATVDFEDKLINATVRNLGGWERVSVMEGEEFDKWLRRDFERIYKSLANHPGMVSQEATEPLVGFHGRNNSLNGYDTDGRFSSIKPERLGLKPIIVKTSQPIDKRLETKARLEESK